MIPPPPRNRLRYPSEILTLAFTLALGSIIVVVLTPFTVGVVLLLVGGGFLLQWILAATRIRALRRQGIPAEKHPPLQRVVLRCRERLGARLPTDVFLLDHQVHNAFATGFSTPYTVVAYTGLLEHLDEDEAAFILGHELGHVELRHTAILTLVGQLGGHSYGVPYLGMLLRLLFLAWSRVAEHSADRAGLVACGDLSAAVRALLKVSVGPEQAARTDVAELIRRWQDQDAGIQDHLGQVLSTHPGLSVRIDRLVDWATADSQYVAPGTRTRMS